MNEAQNILSDIAGGTVPIKYRAALQSLIKQKGQSLLRAAVYDELLKNEIQNPLKKAMQSMRASRATIFRDHAVYKHLFEAHHV